MVNTRLTKNLSLHTNYNDKYDIYIFSRNPETNTLGFDEIQRYIMNLLVEAQIHQWQPGHGGIPIPD